MMTKRKQRNKWEMQLWGLSMARFVLLLLLVLTPASEARVRIGKRSSTKQQEEHYQIITESSKKATTGVKQSARESISTDEPAELATKEQLPTTYTRRLRYRGKRKNARSGSNSRLKGVKSEKSKRQLKKGIVKGILKGSSKSIVPPLLIGGLGGAIAGGAAVGGAILGGIILQPAFSMTSAPTIRTSPPTAMPTQALTAAPTVNPERQVMTRSLSTFAISTTEDRLPTNEEVEGVFEQLMSFFNASLTDAYPNLRRANGFPVFELIEGTVTVASSEVRGPFLVTDIYYTALSTFADPDCLPDPTEIDIILEFLDYTIFVQEFIPDATPEGTIFLGTVQVVTNSGLEGEITSTFAISNFVFSDTGGEVPSQEEIDGVIEQLTLFFTDILQEEFPGFESVELSVADFNSLIQGMFTVTDISYAVAATFTAGFGVTQEEINAVLEDADFSDFIANYLPDATPEDTLFQNTLAIMTDTGATGQPTLPAGTTSPTMSKPTQTPAPTLPLGSTFSPTPPGSTFSPTLPGSTFSPTPPGSTFPPTGQQTQPPTNQPSNRPTSQTSTQAPSVRTAPPSAGTAGPTIPGQTMSPTAATALPTSATGGPTVTLSPTAVTAAPTIPGQTLSPTATTAAPSAATAAPTIPGQTLSPTATTAAPSAATAAPTIPGQTLSPTATTAAPSAATAAPTIPGQTLSPTAAVAIVQTQDTLQLFMTNVFFRTPTQTEIDGMMQQIGLFYTDVLTAAFTNLQSFTATELSSSSVTDVRLGTVTTDIQYLGTSTFTSGSTVPSAAEVDAVIAAADLNVFLANYVPNATPAGTIFENTPTLMDIVETTATLTYIMDPATRIPDQTEIDGAMAQVNLFYADTLSNAFTNFQSFTATELSSVSENRPFIGITQTRTAYSAQTMFTPGTTTPSVTEVETVIDGANLETFRTTYLIPNTTPDTSLFTSTTSVTTSTGTAAPTVLALLDYKGPPNTIAIIISRPPMSIPASVSSPADPVVSLSGESLQALATAPTTAPTMGVAVVETVATLVFVIDQAFGRVPRQQEINGVMEQVNLFYTDLLAAKYNNFDGFTAVETGSVNEKRGFITVTRVAYNAYTTFRGTNIPTEAEVEQMMDSVNFREFIYGYVPNATPSGTIFAHSISVTTTVGTSAPTAYTQTGTGSPTKSPGRESLQGVTRTYSEGTISDVPEDVALQDRSMSGSRDFSSHEEPEAEMFGSRDFFSQEEPDTAGEVDVESNIARRHHNPIGAIDYVVSSSRDQKAASSSLKPRTRPNIFRHSQGNKREPARGMGRIAPRGDRSGL